MHPIQLAKNLGLRDQLLHPYGNFACKIDLKALDEMPRKGDSKLILVTATTPTPFGEGKTTTAIGLSMALHKSGHPTVVTLRQSSMGPVFGTKGGGAGGGKSHLEPLEDSILHLTGDMHAVTQAHNQLAALVDNALFHERSPTPAAELITFPRAIDVNDRFLRDITVGTQIRKGKYAHASQFVITSASEIMAILALVSGNSQAEVIRDLKGRLGRIVIGASKTRGLLRASDVGAVGACAAILKKALWPNLMRTCEDTPALVHTGPFANIAHGCSSIVADTLALRVCDYVITEAGFGVDLGAEKFFDIKCRRSGHYPAAVVVVTTVRSMKYHSGNHPLTAKKDLPESITEENPEEVCQGALNLKRHIDILKNFEVPIVVAINHHQSDHPSEINALTEAAYSYGASKVALSHVYRDGSTGATELAEAVRACSKNPSTPRVLYPLEWSVTEKIAFLARHMYHAAGVDYSEIAKIDLRFIRENAFESLPICMAKTPLSFSHDASQLGVPSGFILPIRRIMVSAGAGFVFPMAGSMTTMPGLRAEPLAHRIDLDEDGTISGLA